MLNPRVDLFAVRAISCSAPPFVNLVSSSPVVDIGPEGQIGSSGDFVSRVLRAGDMAQPVQAMDSSMRRFLGRGGH